MSSITLSAGVRQNLASLQATSALQSLTQNRLATGKKVNSALDNPTSFFTASGLSNRAGDLSKLLDTMGQAVKTLEAADKGIKAISKLVENAQSLANQAKATTEAKEAQAVGAAVSASVTGNVDLSSFTSTAGTLTVTVDGVDRNISITAGQDGTTTAQQIDTALNAYGVDATLDGNNLKLTAQAAGASKTIAVKAGGLSTALFGTTTDVAGKDEVTVAQDAVSPDASRSKLATDFAEIRKQIDQLVKDSGYNGINLLAGDGLKVTFNEKGDSELNITGKPSDTSASGLNIRAASNSWATNTDVQAALDDLKAATDTLRSSAASFGASLSIVQNRQDFTRGMIDTLNNGADELTNADMNQEAANLLALNTRAQLANSALAMAAQQEQGILRLF
ncbi:flagellin [Microvirga massiliensis]|uniref:flagellin N-terminal helical domain-containing protein n=1 Tax=Microvirga massiliensis TaxID=1033741 RepID=UPI00062BEF93|nr:flagellin [Microvirga massiliensis]